MRRSVEQAYCNVFDVRTKRVTTEEGSSGDEGRLKIAIVVLNDFDGT